MVGQRIGLAVKCGFYYPIDCRSMFGVNVVAGDPLYPLVNKKFNSWGSSQTQHKKVSVQVTPDIAVANGL